MTEFIVISDKIEELSGKGEEYLIDFNGNVIAKFYNGSLMCEQIVNINREESTLKVA